MHEFGAPLVIEEIEIDAPAPDEVSIRTVASGICHSDVSAIEGAFPWAAALPVVLGHEAAGIVERIGAAVTDLEPGDHVVTTPSAAFGRCEWCIRGKPFS